MLVVKVELHSAITCKVTELGRMTIANVGGTDKIGDYEARVLKKPRFNVLTRSANVLGHRRKDLPVWVLIARALMNMGYLPQAGNAPKKKCEMCGLDEERPYDESCAYPQCPGQV